MKRIVRVLFVLGSLISPLSAFPSGARGRAVLEIGTAHAEVEYGRPSIKGRDVAEMLRYFKSGQEWRMGADGPTTLKTTVNLRFRATVIPKGQYILKAKYLGETNARQTSMVNWQLLLQKEDETTVAEVPLKFEKAESSVEIMTIHLEKQGSQVRLTVLWGNFTLSATFRKA